MERFNVIKDYCIVNGLTQINNSWTQTATELGGSGNTKVLCIK